MITNISPQEMKHYLQCQMENFFPDRKTGSYFQGSDIDCAINEAYERMENCFKVLTNSAYSNESGQSFLIIFMVINMQHFYISFQIIYGNYLETN